MRGDRRWSVHMDVMALAARVCPTGSLKDSPGLVDGVVARERIGLQRAGEVLQMRLRVHAFAVGRVPEPHGGHRRVIGVCCANSMRELGERHGTRGAKSHIRRCSGDTAMRIANLTSSSVMPLAAPAWSGFGPELFQVPPVAEVSAFHKAADLDFLIDVCQRHGISNGWRATTRTRSMPSRALSGKSHAFRLGPMRAALTSMP